VYSGANRLHGTTLLDTPCGLVVFRQTEESKVPALAVACSDWLYVFKSMKPHMNFRVPSVDGAEAEQEAWLAARSAEVRYVCCRRWVCRDTDRVCRDWKDTEYSFFFDLNLFGTNSLALASSSPGKMGGSFASGPIRSKDAVLPHPFPRTGPPSCSRH
jgi:hypothetical protein